MAETSANISTVSGTHIFLTILKQCYNLGLSLLIKFYTITNNEIDLVRNFCGRDFEADIA